MSERMENSLLTKSQRQLEMNEIFYLNLRRKSTAVLKATVQVVERLF